MTTGNASAKIKAPGDRKFMPKIGHRRRRGILPGGRQLDRTRKQLNPAEDQNKRLVAERLCKGGDPLPRSLNSEFRIPKLERRPNSEFRRREPRTRYSLRHSGFGFLSDFGLRISVFSFRGPTLIRSQHSAFGYVELSTCPGFRRSPICAVPC